MKKILSTLMIACILPLCSGCDNEDVENTKKVYPIGPVFSSSEKTRTDAIQDFAIRFMGAMSNKFPVAKGNIMGSPLSASMLLSLTANAVDDDACQEIIDALGLPESTNIEELNETMRKIAFELPHDAKGSVFKCSNGLWYSKNSEIGEELKSSLTKFYNCKPTQLDYSNPKSYNIPNKWVKDNTKGKIDYLPGMDEISGDIPLYAANAVYFEANWEEPFKEKNTHDAEFHNFDESTCIVKMMMGQQDIPIYWEDEDGILFQLRYKNPNIRMSIYIPNEATEENLSDYSKLDVEARYNNDGMSTLLGGQSIVYLPKVDFKTGVIELNDILKSLGINKIFDRSNSPFSQIKYKGNNAVINGLAQQLCFAMQEQGVVVAAVTSELIIIANNSKIPEKIKVDRPFLFCINAYGLPLIYGRIVNLKEK